MVARWFGEEEDNKGNKNDESDTSSRSGRGVKARRRVAEKRRGTRWE